MHATGHNRRHRIVGIDVTRPRAVPELRGRVVHGRWLRIFDVRLRTEFIDVASGAIWLESGELPSKRRGIRDVASTTLDIHPVVWIKRRSVPIEYKRPCRRAMAGLARQSRHKMTWAGAGGHTCSCRSSSAMTRRAGRDYRAMVHTRRGKGHRALVTAIARRTGPDMPLRHSHRASCANSAVTRCAWRGNAAVIDPRAGESERALVAGLARRIRHNVPRRLSNSDPCANSAMTRCAWRCDAAVIDPRTSECDCALVAGLTGRGRRDVDTRLPNGSNAVVALHAVCAYGGMTKLQAATSGRA